MASTSYNSSTTPDKDLVRASNWGGYIPVVLTLAPTDLGTTMMPHPIHLMLNRGSYLHVGLRGAIQRLHKFAPATLSFASSGMMIRKEPEPQGHDDDADNANEKNSNDKAATAKNSNHNSPPSNSTTNSSTQTPWKFPVCWLEDEETQLPLRWHIFAGVLFDMMQVSKQQQQQSSSSLLQERIPWKIRLHFSSYPTSQLLPLEADEVWPTIERSFKNSLKQALFLQYGNSKVAMNMSKQVHERLWDAVKSSNYKLYQQINADLQATPFSVQLIPIRLFLDSKPPIQRPCPGKGTEPDTDSPTTLGSIFLDWLPDLFRRETPNYNDGDDEGCCKIEPVSESYQWIVAGITPPLSIPILELWENLCHPDLFLYIVVLTR